MSKTISIHSFRGGTGKSNTSANLSYTLASMGKKVAVVDTDIQSPGIHIILGMSEPPMGSALNNYLWGEKPIREVAHDVSANVGLEAGSLHLVPSSIDMGEITKILQEGYDVGLLNEGFKSLKEELALDYLIVDTHPGINEETLLSIAISDHFVIIMRPDQQDFQGTSVTVEIAKRLNVANTLLVVNKALSKHDAEQIKAKVESTYEVPVAAVLPLNEMIVETASTELFVKKHPDEPWSLGVKSVAERLCTS